MTLIEAPERHHHGLEFGPFLRANAEHGLKAVVVIDKPTVWCAPRQNKQLQIGAMLFERQVLGVPEIRICPQRERGEFGHQSAPIQLCATLHMTVQDAGAP